MLESPYLTQEEIVSKDLQIVDKLVAGIAPALGRIVAIVKKHGVKDFAIFVKYGDGKQTNFVMSDEGRV